MSYWTQENFISSFTILYSTFFFFMCLIHFYVILKKESKKTASQVVLFHYYDCPIITLINNNRNLRRFPVPVRERLCYLRLLQFALCCFVCFKFWLCHAIHKTKFMIIKLSKKKNVRIESDIWEYGVNFFVICPLKPKLFYSEKHEP